MNVNIKISKKVFNDVYLPYLDNEDRYLIFYGGGSSGKSYFVGERWIYKLLNPNKKCNLLVVRQTGDTNRKSTFPLLKQVISNWNLAKHFKINESDMRIKCLLTGNEVAFAGLDDVEKIKSITFESGELTHIWVEEATECQEASINQLKVFSSNFGTGIAVRVTADIGRDILLETGAAFIRINVHLQYAVSRFGKSDETHRIFIPVLALVIFAVHRDRGGEIHLAVLRIALDKERHIIRVRLSLNTGSDKLHRGTDIGVSPVLPLGVEPQTAGTAENLHGHQKQHTEYPHGDQQFNQGETAYFNSFSIHDRLLTISGHRHRCRDRIRC